MYLKNGIAIFLAIFLLFQPVYVALAVDVEMMEEKTIEEKETVSMNSVIIPVTDSEDDPMAESMTDSENDFESSSAMETKEDMSNTLPTFQVEEVEGNLYGILSHIPEGTEDISVLCSIGGLTYNLYGYGWDLTKLTDGTASLRQLCLGADEHPIKAFRRKAINRLFIRLELLVDGETILTDPVILSNDLNIAKPETPLSFTASIQYSEYNGYTVEGEFKQIPANVVRVLPMYSLDGQNYSVVQSDYTNDWNLSVLGTEEEEEKFYLENQLCVLDQQEPLKGYLANQMDQFYLRLQITTDDGDIYDTQAVCIERGESQPAPDELSLSANWKDTMLDPWGEDTQIRKDGRYQITVRENATPKEVKALLPDTLPINISFWKKSTDEFYTSGIVECKITWKELQNFQLKAGETVTLPDAANSLEISAGTEVVTAHGKYILPKPMTIGGSQASGKVNIMLSAIGMDEEPDLSLYDATLRDYGTLSLAFRKKPSGATSIKAYVFTQEDSTHIEIGELLTRRKLNHNQWAEIYGFVPLLRPEEPPFQNLLNGEIDSLFIVVKVEGGIFDGSEMTLTWPGEYDPPLEIPEGGSEGNKGDSGSDNDSNGGSGDDGGQRPSLPTDQSGSESSEPTLVIEEPVVPILAEEIPDSTNHLDSMPTESSLLQPHIPSDTYELENKSEVADSQLAATTLPSLEDGITVLPNEEKLSVQKEALPKRESENDSLNTVAGIVVILCGGSIVVVGLASASGGIGWIPRFLTKLKGMLRYK